MNHGFHGSAQAVNGLGINIYLAKVFSSLLGKPTGATEHLLAGQQACGGPRCRWRWPRGLWEFTIRPFCQAPSWQPLASALAAHTSLFPSPLLPVLPSLPWSLFLRMAHNICKQAKCGPPHQPEVVPVFIFVCPYVCM